MVPISEPELPEQYFIADGAGTVTEIWELPDSNSPVVGQVDQGSVLTVLSRPSFLPGHFVEVQYGNYTGFVLGTEIRGWWLQNPSFDQSIPLSLVSSPAGAAEIGGIQLGNYLSNQPTLDIYVDYLN